MLPRACPSGWLKQKETQAPAWFIPLGPAEGEEGAGGGEEEEGAEDVCGIKRMSPPFPNNARVSPAYTLLLSQL